MADATTTGCHRRRSIFTIALAVITVATVVVPAHEAHANKPVKRCTVTTTTVKTLFGGVSHLKIVKQCVYSDEHDGDSASSGPPTRTLVCGASTPDPCGTGDVRACFVRDPATGRPAPAAPFATQTLIKGTWSKPTIWCPGDPAPAAALAGLRAQAQRLLPRVRIGSAWTDTALVNAEVVLWADTDTDRALNAASVLGQRVQLRIAFEHARWDFGDGDHDSTTEPGKVYDGKRDPCDTAQCARYYGHTYLHTGRMTITLAITWRARFSLDGGATWSDIDEPITGPPASTSSSSSRRAAFSSPTRAETERRSGNQC